MPNETKQVEVVKAVAPIVTSMIALLGTVAVAFLQTYSASDSKVEQIVAKIDNSVIPKLEDTITNLRERVAVLEAYTKLQTMLLARAEHTSAGSIGSHKPSPSVAPEAFTSDYPLTAPSKPEAAFELPRLNVQQAIDPDKKSLL